MTTDQRVRGDDEQSAFDEWTEAQRGLFRTFLEQGPSWAPFRLKVGPALQWASRHAPEVAERYRTADLRLQEVVARANPQAHWLPNRNSRRLMEKGLLLPPPPPPLAVRPLLEASNTEAVQVPEKEEEIWREW